MTESKLKGVSFWEVEEKYFDSTLWRVLLSLRHNLFNKFYFKLKDGSRVKFFKDPWLKGHCIGEELDQRSRLLLGPDSLRVGPMIRGNMWSLPPPPTSTYRNLWKAILQTELHSNMETDCVVWDGSSDGKYSVKQGHIFCTTKLPKWPRHRPYGTVLMSPDFPLVFGGYFTANWLRMTQERKNGGVLLP